MLLSSAWADSLPAGVRACASELDRDKRLACYDREVARVVAAANPTNAGVSPDTKPKVETTAQASRPTAITSGAAAEPRHLSARVVRIDYAADGIVVQLDNDQVWQAVPDSIKIDLRTGETVDLDRQGRSWWLSGPYGRAIEVRLKN